ncbi:MAG: DUF115 domain-containing protein [Lentisphaerales bacterium]|nr:DUF115 domain-containing protein [Lentisphaerales bacterium]
MGLKDWQYTSIRDGVEQFVYTPTQGRSKMTENPHSPELELLAFLDGQEKIDLLFLSPCSLETYTTAREMVQEVIVIDYCRERLELFRQRNPKARVEVLRNHRELSQLLQNFKVSLEQGRVCSYMPDRFAHLDKELKVLLYDELLKIQKEEASFAVNRSLKRWHTNMNLLINLKHLNSTVKSFPVLSVPHVIVGAGPSLDENIQTLKKYSGKVIIVATDGAVQSLIANEVKPDFIVSKEDTLMSWRFVAGIEDTLVNVPLLIDSKGNHYLVRNYPGQVILTRSSSFEKWAEQGADKLLLLETGSCVGHMAFNFAIACGASEIIMVGFDLAFKDEAFHPKDMPVPYFHGMVEPEIDFVEGYAGQKLRTDISMKVYLRHFEEMIYRTNIPVTDATEGGALIEGTSIRTLEEVLKDKVQILKNINMPSISLSNDSFSVVLEQNLEDQILEPFTSYLIQNGENFSDQQKQEDLDEARKFLEVLQEYPVKNGLNKAAFVNEGTDEAFLNWIESKGICTYTPASLTESLKLCKELELSTIYCCNAAVDPDLLLLTDVSIFDVKTSKDVLPYERCLWSLNYKVLADSNIAEFWRLTLPDDVDVETVDLWTQEVEYGLS